MDKAAMKAIFRSAGLLSPRYLVVPGRRLRREIDGVVSEISREIGYPCFVKPSNGGSSVGVTKVKSPADLPSALADAAAYDRRVIVEESIAGQEIECAVLGNDDPEASVVGEIVPCNEFYDYSAKYLEDGSELIIPARITDEQAREVRRVSIAAFKALDCAGMARVDFFVRRSDGAVVINEINTIPGFTPISMYPRLWDACGVGFTELVNRLIALALERHEQRGEIARRYQPRLKAPSHG
jgi:D-alanine-D-alanine ligase